MAQVVELLPSKHKALSLPPREKKKKVLGIGSSKREGKN
jgi:hypothetical protein